METYTIVLIVMGIISVLFISVVMWAEYKLKKLAKILDKTE